jgi:hypothetical protein
MKKRSSLHCLPLAGILLLGASHASGAEPEAPGAPAPAPSAVAPSKETSSVFSSTAGTLSLGSAGSATFSGVTTISSGAPISFGVPASAASGASLIKQGGSQLSSTGTLSLGPRSATSSGTVAFKESGSHSPEMVPEMIDHHREATTKLLVAIQAADFPGFLFRGDAAFQKFDREQFNGLARQWGVRVSAGFGLTYLGEMKKQRSLTTVWRVQFNDRGDDAIMLLSSNSRGSVTGFALQ